MENSLIPPIQLWEYGITVDVVPKQYSDGRSIHGMHHPDENIFVPFYLHGCISYFSTRLPTLHEINTCRRVTFTSDSEWDPYSSHFKEAENAMINHNQYPDPLHLHFNHQGEPLDGRFFGAVYVKGISTSSQVMTIEIDPSIATFDFTFGLTETKHIHATRSKEHRSSVPMDTLAKRWGIGINTATETIKNTTQRGLRYLEGPLSRRFRIRQKQLDNRYLNTNMYTDTLFMDKASARGNECVQLFVTAEGFVTGKPMKTKADAYEVLEYVCREYGVPRLLVSDTATVGK